MADIDIRTSGRAGRITLNRPKALNALTYDMILDIERALDAWRDDDAVDLVIIDAAGDKAFCAGGDIAEMYRTASSGDYTYGRTFWADEYRLNAKIAEYPKPYVAFMQGFTMGGGVGVSCHGSHRIVGDSSKIAMPECGIGLVPDVGGSLLLARAPGRTGEYLGTTTARMDAGDAIFAGFADHFIPEAAWDDLIARLEETGDVADIDAATRPAPKAGLAALQDDLSRHFGAGDMAAVAASLAADTSDFATRAGKGIGRVSPLSACTTLALIGRARTADTIRAALDTEYRVTWRCAENGDFVEGIRAAIIDKDNAPRWRHHSVADVTAAEVEAMLAPIPGTIEFEGGPS